MISPHSSHAARATSAVGSHSELPLDRGRHRLGELWGGREQDGGAGGAVLGLAEEVDGASSASHVSSAMISVSVGPARRSIPTRPKSWRFASAT